MKSVIMGLFFNNRGSIRVVFRVLLFLALFVGLMVVSLALTPNKERLAALFHGELEALAGAVGALKMLLCGLCATLVMVKVLDRRPFAAVGLTRHPGALGDVGRGLLVGALLMSIPPVLLLLLGHANLEDPSVSFTSYLVAIPLFVLATLVIALNEELLFRGYLFQVLIEGLGGRNATLLLSILFGIAHYKNPNGTWAGALGAAMYGIIISYAYLRTMSLWFPIGIHWAANFVEGIVWGLPTSGHTYAVVMVRTRLTGPALFTGGAFGPEAGIFTPCAVVVGFLMIYWWRSLRPSAPMRGYWDQYIRPTDRPSEQPADGVSAGAQDSVDHQG